MLRIRMLMVFPVPVIRVVFRFGEICFINLLAVNLFSVQFCFVKNGGGWYFLCASYVGKCGGIVVN